MNRRAIGVILLAAGVLVFLVAATADRVGLGGAPGFGWKQLLGVVLGVGLAAYGAVRLRSVGA